MFIDLLVCNRMHYKPEFSRFFDFFREELIFWYPLINYIINMEHRNEWGARVTRRNEDFPASFLHIPLFKYFAKRPPKIADWEKDPVRLRTPKLTPWEFGLWNHALVIPTPKNFQIEASSILTKEFGRGKNSEERFAEI